MARTSMDPATAGRRKRAHVRRIRWLVVALAFVAGGLAIGLHTETPFVAQIAGFCDGVRFAVECDYPVWIYAIAGVAGAAAGLILGSPALLIAIRRDVPPTVACRSCGAVGWIEDLEPRRGRCLRCAGHRFDYRAYTVGPVWLPGSALFLPERVVETDAAGEDLIARYGSTRPH